MKAIWWMFLPALCMFTGCIGQEGSKGLPLVPGNPFGAPPPVAGSMNFSAPKAGDEATLKVDRVGRNLVTANKQLGLRPYFVSLGSPTVEVFHLEQKTVYVTEGLIKKCKTEEELAAVLARELGKMVAEREFQASEDIRNPERPPPSELANTSAAPATNPEPSDLFQLVKQELSPPRPRPLPRPNPENLAGGYLEKAGYPRAGLNQAQAVLEEADRHCALERQLRGLPAKNGWEP